MKKLVLIAAVVLMPLAVGAASKKECRNKYAQWFYACDDKCSSSSNDDDELVACRRVCSKQLEEKVKACMAE